MQPYQEMPKEELLKEKESLLAAYEEFKKRGLKLNMARGKPSEEQVNLSLEMLTDVNPDTDMIVEDGVDVRNYGVIDGIYGAKQIIATMAKSEADHVIVFGNSSLNVMFDMVSHGMVSGIAGHTPWYECKDRKWLCPVPGYDRHFAITEYFGFEMINIPMNDDGPDMDMIEELVSKDPSIKGIWCVPKYSNPQGYSYSDETVRRFARLKPAARDFRIFWDNAYGIHHLYETPQDYLIEILAECKRAGNPDMVYKFASTSKITFPGSGIAALATSKNNLEDIEMQLRHQTIGHDKVNQLRHVRFFGDIHGMMLHMVKHADILRPKFEAVEQIFEENLAGLGIGTWTNPKGGYFISFDALEGCAKRIVEKARKAGVILTGAGATWPYGKDPYDSNIRIAPSYPPLEDLKTAARLFTVCVRYISIKKILENMDAA